MMDRRTFIQSVLASTAAYGGIGLLGSNALAQTVTPGFSPISNNILVNTFLSGGPDMRHLIVPRPTAGQNTYGFQYWSNRANVHGVGDDINAWMTRYNDAYFEITVDGNGFGSNVDINGANTGVRFGILRQAGWLIEQFQAGNAALVFNVAGVNNRAHDRAQLQINQGDIEAQLDESNRSGWGGRLARVANANVISVTNTPQPFGFGPSGSAANFDPNVIDNRSLLSIPNSREFGLNEFLQTNNSLNVGHRRLARALNRYYDNLRNTTSRTDRAPYDKARAHEEMLRSFSNLLNQKLDTVNTPDVVTSLSNNRNAGGLRNRGFAQQIASLFDTLASNDLLDARVVSLEYGGFDTHANQQGRIEGNFQDLFGGPFAGQLNEPRGAFSALQQGLVDAQANGRGRVVYTFFGEFGRQLRGNGDDGTDHGSGNLMIVVGNRVTGGLYGDMFPQGEVARYSNNNLNTPDIETLTHTEFLFGRVCDWVQANSAERVFPRLANTSGGNVPILESGVDFSNLIT